MVATPLSVTHEQEAVLVLAEAALKRRIRPILDHSSSISTRLFNLEADVECKSRALSLLETAYASTAPSNLGRQDARIYRREYERRTKQLQQLQKERAELLLAYAQELLDASVQQPELVEFYGSLSQN